MAKKELGIKTKSFVYSMLFCAVFMFFLAGLSIVLYVLDENIIYLITLISAILAIGFSVYKFIQNAKVPKILIEYDENGIYINSVKDTIFINYNNIKALKPNKTTFKGRTYEYGSIDIVTKDDISHHVGVIYDVEEVSKQF